MDESEVKFTINHKNLESKESISSFSMISNNDEIFKTSHLYDKKKTHRRKNFQTSQTDD